MPRNQFWFVWILLLLAGVVLAVTLVTSTKTKLDYQAIVVEGTAVLPTADQQLRRHLHDGDELTQWFVAPVRRLVRIGLGASDPRSNPPTALLVVDLVSEAGEVIASTSTSVSQLREDDITLLPLAASIKPGTRYGLLIRTKGVSKLQPIDIYYDSDEPAPPDTMIEYRAAETPEHLEQLPGALRWQVIQDFTTRGVVDALWHSPLAAIVLAYWLLLVAVVRPVGRRWLTAVLTERLEVLGSHKISWRQWLGVWLLGFSLALIVTWPFYTQLQQFDTQGDVNRALIFRGIGRDSFLEDKEIARWDHYSCGGWPLLANIESAHLDPFFPLVLLFGEQLGLRITVTAILAIGFVGAWALARRLGQADPIIALLAGAIFSYSGFQMLAFSYGVFAWLPVGLIPWMLYFLLKSQQRTWQVVWAAMLLAAIFLGGGAHMPVFAVLTALLLMIGLAIAYRSWRPLVLLLLVLLLTSSLTAVKLVPAVELTGLFDSFSREDTFLAPLSWAPKIFWDREQLTTDPWVFPPTGEVSRWTEFGSYVGIVPVLLLVIGWPLFARDKRLGAVLGSATILFVMIFGLWPWSVLREIPLLGEIVRTPSRLRSVLVLLLGILVAASASRWLDRLIVRPPYRALVAVAVVGFVLADLVVLHQPLFKDLFDLPEQQLVVQRPFERVVHGFTAEEVGYYRSAYLNYLANQGVTDLCVPYMTINRPTVTRGRDTSNPARPYLGEAYFLTGEPVTISELGANSFTVQIEEPANRRLIINENFFPGWETEPPGEVVSHLGLLSTRVTQADSSIIWRYNPLSYRLGLIISVASLLLVLAWVFSEVKKIRPD